MRAEHAIYISGPMRGIPEFNFPAFNDAAAEFSRLGWKVFNPADGGYGSGDPATGTGVTEEEVMGWLRQDVAWLARASAIAVLPGWEESEGSQFECFIAWKLGLDFYDAVTLDRFEPEIELLEEAA